MCVRVRACVHACVRASAHGCVSSPPLPHTEVGGGKDEENGRLKINSSASLIFHTVGCDVQIYDDAPSRKSEGKGGGNRKTSTH